MSAMTCICMNDPAAAIYKQRNSSGRVGMGFEGGFIT